MFLLILCGDAIIGFCNYENSNTIPLMQNLAMTRWGEIWNLLSMFDYGLLYLFPLLLMIDNYHIFLRKLRFL
ncbi:hypothetical protein [Helicobacter rodentium]|uniref:hypothetical protein n=1 Tax=Helicobacter rodentium TaxID=59617 RepID=UPI000A56BBF2|nr:hypothetical protein [Helicobacter rodentium]